MKGCVRTAATVAGLLVVFVALVVFLLWRGTVAKTEDRIQAALAARYPAAQLIVRDRQDWSYANQICFDLIVVAGSTRSRRILMVQGDLDGGTWAAGREFGSMAACKAAYYHG